MPNLKHKWKKNSKKENNFLGRRWSKHNKEKILKNKYMRVWEQINFMKLYPHLM